MAIKISGTTVIDDGRNLQNTLNVNATGNVYANTFVGDGSNLSGMPQSETVNFSSNNIVYDSGGYITSASYGGPNTPIVSYSNVQYETVGFLTAGEFKRIISYRETITGSLSIVSRDVTVSYNSNGAISQVSIA